MFTDTSDKSVVDSEGKVIYFSTERFLQDVVRGDCCFICGARPDQVEFNDEHVVPDWVLRRYNLHDVKITLPNDVGFRYGQYKIPCCQPCNSRMGEELETPVRSLIDKGYNALVENLRQDGPRLLFTWLSLIFVKAHLKDKSLRQNLDPREVEGMIGDAYAWEQLHHVHCVARSFYSGCELDDSAYGSILVWPAKQAAHFPPFDYRDVYASQTMLLRLGNIALFAVLNDACASMNLFESTARRFKGPLSPVQLRETLGHFTYLNQNLKERPRFFTNVNHKQEKCQIISQTPALMGLTSFEAEKLGEVVFGCCQDVLTFCGCSDDIEAIKQGKWTFLFRADGNFNSQSMDDR